MRMTTTSTIQHVYRQRSSLALAAGCAVTGVLLLLSLARDWGAYPRPLFVAWVVLGLAVTWAVFVRPAILLDVGGVTLRNVLRDVHIPWTLLTGATSRWNVKVMVGHQAYTAWAISSEAERPKGVSAGMFRLPMHGRLHRVANEDAQLSSTAAKVTAQTVVRSIRAAKQEYDQAVAEGELPAVPEGTVRVTWVPLVMLVLLVPAVVVLALSLI
jgi:hypothetical protein